MGVGHIVRGLLAWFIIIFAESIHGTLRVLFLEPIVGDFKARQIAFFTGMIIILSIGYLFINWINVKNQSQLYQVGFLWMFLTLLFEIILGRFLMNYTWDRIFEDYNFSKGGLMGFGLLFLLFAPKISFELLQKSKTKSI